MTDEELDRLTAPQHYGRPLPVTRVSERTRAHRCGECSWQGSGSIHCPNYRREVSDVRDVRG